MADVILLSTADWDHPLWTNKQHQALSLAEAGHRVLYIDSLGVRGARATRSDSSRILRRLSRSLWPLRRVHPGVWVLSPLVMPGRIRGVAGRLSRWSLNLALFWADLRLDLRRPLLWTYNPNTRFYLKLGRFQATIYHCVDRIQAQPGMPEASLDLAEHDLCGAVNAVFTTAPELQRTLAPLNAGTHLFGNVADADHFGAALNQTLAPPPDLPSIAGPCLMFIGAIDGYKLDLVMLEALIARTPSWTYVLIGPIGAGDPDTDVEPLRSHPNVHLLGARPYAELPAYLSCADVALLPLQLNDYTRHMDPMKFFEYLAAGCPVVATAIPSLAAQGDVASLCPPDPEAFQRAIEALLRGDGPSRSMRLARARDFTYERRTDAMVACLRGHGLLPPEPMPPQAVPYHRVRRQLRLSWIGGQSALAFVQIIERCTSPAWGSALLDRLLRIAPNSIDWLAARASRALAAGDHAVAVGLIERIWRLDGEAEILHQLLFRRGSRPGDRRDQLEMFDALAASERLPLHFAGYCRVVRTYRAIDAKDPAAIRRCATALGTIITNLDADPDTYRCLRPNRENRAKLLISAHLTRLRALMALDDHVLLDDASLALQRCASRYDPFRIDRNTATRMTRNIMRCLAVAAVMAWHSGDGLRFEALFSDVERLHSACHAERFDPVVQRTQEDHRGFADQMLERLQRCRWSVDQPESRPEVDVFVEPILLVYFPELRLERAEKAWRFLRPLTTASPA